MYISSNAQRGTTLSLALAVVFALICLSPLQGQNLGTISGLVTDKTGAAVPGAEVK